MPTLANSGLEYPTVNDNAYRDRFGNLINAILVDQDAELYTRTANYQFSDYQLLSPKVQDVSETVRNAGNKSGAAAFDYREAHWQYCTLTGNITSLTITFPPASGSGGFMTIEMIQDGTGGRTLTLNPSVYKVAGGGTITLSTAAGARDKLYLTTRDGGSTWDVSAALNWS